MKIQTFGTYENKSGDKVKIEKKTYCGNVAIFHGSISATGSGFYEYTENGRLFGCDNRKHDLIKVSA